EVVAEHRNASPPDVPDRLAVILHLLLAAWLPEPDLHPELVRGVLERLDLEAVALDPLAEPDQILVLPALLTRQTRRRGQHHPIAAELFGEDQVLLGDVPRQPDRDPHLVWHSAPLYPTSARSNRAAKDTAPRLTESVWLAQRGLSPPV